MRNRQLGLICLGIGVGLLATTLGWLAYRVDLIGQRLEAADTHVAALQDSLQAEAIDKTLIHQHLVELQRQVDGLVADAGPFIAVLPHLRWVPVHGGDLATAPSLLRLADRLVDAAVTMSDILAPVDTGAGAAALPALAHSLADAERQGRLAHLEALLADAQAARASIDADSLSPRLRQRVGLVDEHLSRLRQALPLLRQAPDMLGAYCPRTYLLLGQNQDELRPTGGYITVAGHLVLDQGRITAIEMRDSYAVDDLSVPYPRPPGPLYTTMGADLWLLRDANWSPDFPTSARQAAELYWLGRRVAVDGVIAFDQAALPLLLKGLEPVEVTTQGGVDQVTAQNVNDLLRLRWAPEPGQDVSGEWWAQRKSFMLSLTQAILERLQQAQGDVKPLPLLQGIDQGLRRKHILIASDHPAWEQALAILGWDGGIPPGTGDLIAAIDANVGFNKASAVVERQADYQVTLHADGSATAYASLVYRHASEKGVSACQITPRYEPVYTDMMDRCYWNYVRLLVPKGAELRSAPHVAVPEDMVLRGGGTLGQVDVEALPTGHAAWGQLFLLAPGETAALDFTYELPTGTATRQPDGTWLYHLRLPKQPGTDRPLWQVSVRLPQEACLLSSTPGAASFDNRTGLMYELLQETDLEIVVRYGIPRARRDGLAGRPS